MEPGDPLRIREWALEDRPREKMVAKGIETLSDAELLAIIIRSGTIKESAVELAKKILASANHNLNELGKMGIKDLIKYRGIGEAKAVTLVAAMELGKRRKSNDAEKRKITDSKDIAAIFQPRLGDLPYEEFWVVFLNRANHVIEKVKVSQGGITGTVIDQRLILKHALAVLATSMILCHNHPSGNVNPSDADISITRKLKDSAKIMDISLLDHLIVSATHFYSFADEGIL